MKEFYVASLSAIVLVLAVSIPAAAESRLDILDPVESSLSPGWEKWTERTQVTGGLKVGVMVNAKGQEITNQQRAKVYLPASTSKTLCVQLTTHDGQYSASLSFALDGIAPGWHMLNIPTKLGERLRGYLTTQLVVLATVTDACDSGAGKHLPVDWDLSVPEDEYSIVDAGNVQIFLNSRVPTNIRLAHANSDPIPCVEQSGPRTSFNLRCDLPISAEMDQRLMIKAGRGRATRNIPLNLWLHRDK